MKKPSYVIEVYEDRDVGFSTCKYIPAFDKRSKSKFEIHVPEKAIFMDRKSYIFSEWAHELGHALCWMFGIRSHAYEGVPTPESELIERVFGYEELENFGKKNYPKIKAEEDAWEAAELMTSFVAIKLESLETYKSDSPEVKARLEFEDLFFKEFKIWFASALNENLNKI